MWRLMNLNHLLAVDFLVFTPWVFLFCGSADFWNCWLQALIIQMNSLSWIAPKPRLSQDSLISSSLSHHWSHWNFWFISRERLRRVLRKKTYAELRLIYIFTSSPLHIHILTYIAAHLHIYIHNCTSTSLLIFIFTHLHLCSCSHLHIYISAHLHTLTSTSHIFTSHLHLTSSPLALFNFLS